MKSFADEPCPPSDPYEWTTLNTALLAAQLTLTTIDIGQTQYFTSKGVAELNPVVGAHPSRELLIGIWIASMAVQTTGAILLPSPWREVWQIAFIVGEGMAVWHNYNAGFLITVPWG